MIEMNLYRAQSGCPKCGNSRENATMWADGKAADKLVDGEHMVRTCSRCQARWPERCLQEGDNF